MPRKQDWPSILAKEIANRGETPFEYGKHDCCLSALYCIVQMLDENKLEHLRDYTGEEGAMTKLKELGGIEGVAQYAADAYGFKPIPINRAGRGDLVVVQSKEDAKSLGVVFGEFAFVAAPIGWGAYRRSHWLKAWRVE